MDAAIWSDINLKVDPEASKIALNADFPNIIVAGNVASTVLTSQEYLEELYEVKNVYTELLHKYFGTTYAFWDVSLHFSSFSCVSNFRVAIKRHG